MEPIHQIDALVECIVSVVRLLEYQSFIRQLTKSHQFLTKTDKF
jgi:hypothetical protein